MRRHFVISGYDMGPVSDMDGRGALAPSGVVSGTKKTTGIDYEPCPSDSPVKIFINIYWPCKSLWEFP